MSITSVTETPIAPSSTSSASTNGNAGQVQNNFLKLLVAQIQYQDPTKPMSSSDMTAQMAQLNVVDGINQLNTTLTGMAGNSQSREALQAASLIGHKVLVPGNNIELLNGSATMGIKLTQPVDDMQVSILDSTGKVVHREELGAQTEGIQNLIWDGTTSTDGSAAIPPYTFRVSATQEGEAVPDTAITPLAMATVNNVSLAGGVTSLHVTNTDKTETNVTLSNIYEIIS